MYYQGLSSFIWSVADLLRGGDYRQSEYGEVILPFTFLLPDPLLLRTAGQSFYRERHHG
jgi:hypothetical protein